MEIVHRKLTGSIFSMKMTKPLEAALSYKLFLWKILE